MKTIKGLSLLIIFFFAIISSIHAQETVNTSGGDASGIGGTVAYSVGQIFFITNSGNTGSKSQGVQQPYEIYIYSGLEEFETILAFEVYPNPTDGMLILETSGIFTGTLTYQLYDLHGKLLRLEQFSGNKTTILMKELAPAVYFLKILDQDKVVKTFKIIKN